MGCSDPSCTYCELPLPDSSMSHHLLSCWGVMLVVQGHPRCCRSWAEPGCRLTCCVAGAGGWARDEAPAQGLLPAVAEAACPCQAAHPPHLLVAAPSLRPSPPSPCLTLLVSCCRPFSQRGIPRSPSQPLTCWCWTVCSSAHGGKVSLSWGRGRQKGERFSHVSEQLQVCPPGTASCSVPVTSSPLLVKACRGQDWDQFQGYFSYFFVNSGRKKSPVSPLPPGRWVAGSSLWRHFSQVLCSLALA